MKVAVEMARGGKMELEVEGRTYLDSDGSGRKWTDIEIESIKWPGGGEVKEKNIKDIHQVEDAFVEALEAQSWHE
jgi:hypothetical protein